MQTTAWPVSTPSLVHESSDLSSHLAPFAALLKRSENRRALEAYLRGLAATIPSKTASGIAAHDHGTSSQRLQEFLTRTVWDEAHLNALRIRTLVGGADHGVEDEGAIVIGDELLRKTGSSSVGVARHRAGGTRAINAQRLVTAHYAGNSGHWPIAARLYLPAEWAGDPARRARARIPADIGYATPGAIALDLLDIAQGMRVPATHVVIEAGLAGDSSFLDALEHRGQRYLVHRESTITDSASLRGARWTPTDAADAVPGARPREFARIRLSRLTASRRPADKPGYLIGVRDAGSSHDASFYYAWGMDDQPNGALLRLAGRLDARRRFYDEARAQLGLEDYEGRLWPGLNRHIALVMLAHTLRCHLA